jgi:hypothetical protein
MKVGEFAKRARASRLKKSAKIDETFKRLRQEIRLSEAPSPSQKPGFSARRQSKRPTLSLFPKA